MHSFARGGGGCGAMKKDKKRPIGGDGRGDGGARERPGGGDDARAAKRWRGGNEKKRTKHAAAGTSDGRGVKPTTKNALRTAQLDKAQLLLFRKFDYGALLWRKYYRAQGIFRDDDELDDTAAAFATPLPVTFRLHATDARANHLKKRLKELQKVALVKPLPWMPNREGWQVVSTRAAGDDEDSHHHHHRRRRREKLPAAVAEVVDRGATAGLLARQEAVSMLPVLVLRPHLRAGDKVLDVCAAPGNKTTQLLEIVSPPDSARSSPRGPGVVVANDAHPNRIKTLREAIERHKRSDLEMQSLVITCAMGQDLPAPTFEDRARSSRGGGGGGGGASTSASTSTSRRRRGYDAVLADVPCSGDGTLRKDPDVLRRWHPGLGNALHQTQLAIASRAAALTRPGGYFLYSTCALNPVEDEAVVASVLLGPGGERFEIVDGFMDDAGLQKMRRREGVRTWGVCEHAFAGGDGARGDGLGRFDSDSDGAGSDSDSDDADDVALRWYDTYEDAEKAGMPARAPSMWPPSDAALGGRDLHLERCARFLPQDGDTGGFFVALLKRAAADDADDADVTDARLTRTQRHAAAAAARASGDVADPVRPLPPGEADAIASRLGLRARDAARLWMGERGTVTLTPSASPDIADLGPVSCAAAGVIALAPRVLAHGEDEDDFFPYDFTTAGAAALGAIARKRRCQVVPSDLQVMLTARAEGVDVASGGEDAKNEIVCLTVDEMSDATRRRWEKSGASGRRVVGAAALVLLRRERGAEEGAPPAVVFSVAGRCVDEGLTLSPEVTVDEANALLERLSELAGRK